MFHYEKWVQLSNSYLQVVFISSLVWEYAARIGNYPITYNDAPLDLIPHLNAGLGVGRWVQYKHVNKTDITTEYH